MLQLHLRCEGLSQMPTWFLLPWGRQRPCSVSVRHFQPTGGSGRVGRLQGVLRGESLHAGGSPTARCGLHARVGRVFVFFSPQIHVTSLLNVSWMKSHLWKRFVCPPGSSKPNAPNNACPPGTLSNRTDLTDRSQCQQCPARYACLRGADSLSHSSKNSVFLSFSCHGLLRNVPAKWTDPLNLTLWVTPTVTSNTKSLFGINHNSNPTTNSKEN